MFVLHGAWHGGQLSVWAEDSALPAATRARSSPRPLGDTRREEAEAR